MGEVGGYGGSIVLEVPVAHDYAEGARVAAARPGRVEAAGYRKRQARKRMLLFVE